MPGWLQPFANHQPVTVTVNAIRALTQGTPPGRDLSLSIFYSLVILAIFIPIASRKFAKG